MGVKIGFLLVAILAGCFADPIINNDIVDSDFFYHTDPSARIVGGTQAADGSVPYMVAMSQGTLLRSFICGGSILTQRTVLTAAHCISAVFSWNSLASSLRVTVGTNTWNRGGQSYSLQRNVTHPNYISQIIKNDLGILITSTNIVFSRTVSPVIVNYDYVDRNVVARAAGWGRIRQGGSLSATLLELFLITIDGETCVRDVAQAGIDNNISGVPPVEPHLELCVTHSPGHGMCNGDSGSALVRVDRQQQIGIVSWGIPCATGAPDMFVRISAFREFLVENVV